MPVGRINSVMQFSDGMGETGETYLVGGDYFMRSDSRFAKESTILKTKVETETVKAALKGSIEDEGSELITGYSGKKVLSSYGLIDFLGTKFVILAEMDEAEVLAPIRNMQMVVVLSALVALTIIAVISVFVSRRISAPITKMVGVMKQIAEDKTDVEIPSLEKQDEIGDMAKTLQVFKENAIENKRLEESRKVAEVRAEEDKKKAMFDLASRFEERVQGMIQSVAAAATELSQTAESMESNVKDVDSKSKDASLSSGRTSQNVATVASASEEMSASVKEISSQVIKSTQVVNDAVRKADAAELSAKSLETASNDIGNVVKLIRDIAEQINLLALNATIESARAGEAGKGFAVVASEVKNLSNQATKATEDISTQIESVQAISAEVFGALNAIKSAVDKVNEYSGGISAAVEEQSATTAEIARNMVVASKGTQEVSDNIKDISDIASVAKDSSMQMLDASRMLSREAEQLSAAVSGFLSEIRNG
jgi:methyl-accepting chemotaxis protein